MVCKCSPFRSGLPARLCVCERVPLTGAGPGFPHQGSSRDPAGRHPQKQKGRRPPGAGAARGGGGQTSLQDVGRADDIRTREREEGEEGDGRER